jgi:hypothetical protein
VSASTETALIEDLDLALRHLHEIKVLGVRVAMDDFGTGSSLLFNLRAFPFDKIKIDQSFRKIVRRLEAICSAPLDRFLIFRRPSVHLDPAFTLEQICADASRPDLILAAFDQKPSTHAPATTKLSGHWLFVRPGLAHSIASVPHSRSFYGLRWFTRLSFAGSRLMRPRSRSGSGRICARAMAPGG